jgi:zinc/manganese transport system ATP-binding protein
MSAVLEVRGASLSFGDRTLWHDLDLTVESGEFVAVLGPNGTGKTSLLKAILGQQHLTAGTVTVAGGSASVGYIPQQKLVADGTPVRARDLVGFGVSGTRWGLPIPRRGDRDRVDSILAAVGASEFANVPVSLLSGGEQQRLRVGQAIAGGPSLLLCDEPLLSLDLAHQRAVSELIDEQRTGGAGVVFVTHDVNPILGMVDRVLYLAGGTFRIGTPDEVLTSSVLSEMYNTPVDVFHSNGRVVVVGVPDEHGDHH